MAEPNSRNQFERRKIKVTLKSSSIMTDTAKTE